MSEPGPHVARADPGQGDGEPQAEAFRGPAVPRTTARRDGVLPILVATSLAVHATIMLPSLLGSGDAVSPAPHEIPVEVIQLPPKPIEKPKVAAAPKPPAGQPKPQKKLEAKAEPPKPAPKSEPRPQKEARKQPPKPSPQKVAAKSPPRPSPRQPPPPPPQMPKPELASASQRLRDLLGAMPAIALPGSSADGTEEVSYPQLVLSKLAKAKKEGRYQGVPGATSVTFTLGDSGEVASVSIVRPSGDPSLDDEAIAMVKRGAPYPPPPPGGRRDYTITLRFQPLI